MPDIVDATTRSRMMGGIRGRDTRPELALRRMLHREGFRYSLHKRSLPGSPDLVLRKWQAAVFVHGCFWHRHEGCRLKTTPATRPEFWYRKFEANKARDQRAVEALRQSGWRVALVWECGLRRSPETATRELIAWLGSDSPAVEIGAPNQELLPLCPNS